MPICSWKCQKAKCDRNPPCGARGYIEESETTKTTSAKDKSEKLWDEIHPSIDSTFEKDKIRINLRGKNAHCLDSVMVESVVPEENEKTVKRIDLNFPSCQEHWKILKPRSMNGDKLGPLHFKSNVSIENPVLHEDALLFRIVEKHFQNCVNIILQLNCSKENSPSKVSYFYGLKVPNSNIENGETCRAKAFIDISKTDPDTEDEYAKLLQDYMPPNYIKEFLVRKRSTDSFDKYTNIPQSNWAMISYIVAGVLVGCGAGNYDNSFITRLESTWSSEGNLTFFLLHFQNHFLSVQKRVAKFFAKFFK